MITQRQWMDLEPRVRADISKLFKIKRSGVSDVVLSDGEYKVKSDGVLERDLEAVMPQMLDYLGLTELPTGLLNLLQEKFYGKGASNEEESGGEAATAEVKPRRRGRPPGKKAQVPTVA